MNEPEILRGSYEPGTSRLASGADADSLRALWQGFLDRELKGRAPGRPPAAEGIHLERDGAHYMLFLRDSIPLEDARGLIAY